MPKSMVLAFLFLSLPLAADEGMWLFNRPPLQQLESKYGFKPGATWLEHLQKSSVRLNNGGSGAFVSPDGLLVTNHHVGLDCLAKLTTAERDYIRGGFKAKARAEEVPCHDLELNVLMSIEDVTARVNAAVPAKGADAEQRRRAVMNTIEKESLDRTGLRSDVVTLFQGAEYHLYRYRKYTDVRLVFAPEAQMAFFGGDPDNFEYPRFTFDVAFFRAYENGKPAKIEHFLRFSESGAAENELVFVSGHPGTTERLKTVAELDFIRELRLPFHLNWLRRREVALMAFAERSAANERAAHDWLYSARNSRKALTGQLAGLHEPAVMGAKRREEQALRAKAGDDRAWKDIAALVERSRTDHVERWFLVTGGAFWGDLFAKARTIVRYVNEVPKPNAERLREFRESNLESLRQGLFSEAPISKELETVTLTDSLTHWLETFPDEPLVKQVLAGKSPRQRAQELVAGTKLHGAAERRRLVAGGKDAVAASTDPMIRLALLVEPRARALRKTYEEEVQEPMRQAYARIRQEKAYPDATFTLRLAFGEVKGYSGSEGAHFPAITTFAGGYARAAEHENAKPFDLPKSWLDAKGKVNPSTPFNFVTTADIIGGNSGSPVVNKAGEFVGIIFDMNLPSLVFNFAFREHDARAVAVHSRGILEALRNVYGATELVAELTRK